MNLEFDFLDEMDKEDIYEMYDEYFIEQLDEENAQKIYNYLLEQGIDFAKDIFIERLELFLDDSDSFVGKFEELKKELGKDYVKIISEDLDTLEKLY